MVDSSSSSSSLSSLSSRSDDDSLSETVSDVSKVSAISEFEISPSYTRLGRRARPERRSSTECDVVESDTNSLNVDIDVFSLYSYRFFRAPSCRSRRVAAPSTAQFIVCLCSVWARKRANVTIKTQNSLS